MNFNKNRSLKNGISQLPQLDRPVASWSIPITLERIKQSIVDGDKIETTEKIQFKGVIQPMKTEELQFKPENLRSFNWLWIHALAGTLNLQTGDKIIYNKERYKIMGVKDYSLYSYIEYEAILDYQ